MRKPTASLVVMNFLIAMVTSKVKVMCVSMVTISNHTDDCYDLAGDDSETLRRYLSRSLYCGFWTFCPRIYDLNWAALSEVQGECLCGQVG